MSNYLTWTDLLAVTELIEKLDCRCLWFSQSRGDRSQRANRVSMKILVGWQRFYERVPVSEVSESLVVSGEYTIENSLKYTFWWESSNQSHRDEQWTPLNSQQISRLYHYWFCSMPEDKLGLMRFDRQSLFMQLFKLPSLIINLRLLNDDYFRSHCHPVALLTHGFNLLT